MRLSVLAAAAFVLAGCQSAITTTTSYDVLFRAGVPSEFGYAAANAGEMPVVVVGNPFDVPKPIIDAAVIEAMQGQNRGSAVRFVEAPQEIAHSGSGYAVLMLLNAGPGIGADFACARRASLAPPVTQGRTTLLAVFCGAADGRSWAYSSMRTVASPSDPLFLQLVRQATFLMLPPRDDDWPDSTFF